MGTGAGFTIPAQPTIQLSEVVSLRTDLHLKVAELALRLNERERQNSPRKTGYHTQSMPCGFRMVATYSDTEQFFPYERRVGEHTSSSPMPMSGRL